MIDLTPLFRSSVGFERMSRLLEAASQLESRAPGYPPYNIEKLGEDSYRITMAVAGFGEEDVDITVTENQLVVSGKAADEAEAGTFLHRGIARRAFERRFELADHIKVTGAELVNGLLHIALVREVPEAKKPRTVKVQAKAEPKTIEGRKDEDKKAA